MNMQISAKEIYIEYFIINIYCYRESESLAVVNLSTIYTLC